MPSPPHGRPPPPLHATRTGSLNWGSGPPCPSEDLASGSLSPRANHFHQPRGGLHPQLSPWGDPLPLRNTGKVGIGTRTEDSGFGLFKQHVAVCPPACGPTQSQGKRQGGGSRGAAAVTPRFTGDGVPRLLTPAPAWASPLVTRSAPPRPPASRVPCAHPGWS